MKDFKTWGIKTRKYPEKNYHSIWYDLKTLRLGKEQVKELDPNHSEFYDVSLGSKCQLMCNFCYVNANNNGRFYSDIISKAEMFFGSMDDNQKPYQIAIGSEGEPTIHPDFCEFLKTIYNLNIVPNYTTNGITIANDDELSESILKYTSDYCGGVAVSANSFNDNIDSIWRKAVNKLATINMNINIHYIISDMESVNKFIEIYDEFKDKVAYFVLLPLMNSGRSETRYDEKAFELLLTKELDMSKIAFGANFYESLIDNQDKVKCMLYPPESMSKNLILDDEIKITPSSFSNEVIWSIKYK